MKKTRTVTHEFSVDDFLTKLGINSDKVVALDTLSTFALQTLGGISSKSVKITVIEEVIEE